MQKLNNRILCASAGTGKTYRLSLEYLAIILQYYGKAEFSLDNILALTFTRKATAEIRERILQQINLLTANNPETEEAKASLVENLRKLVPGELPELSQAEINLLESAKREIINDQSRMQVMTIDSYISHIFKNIVRPLRNIETYEIDTEAIRKRMPFLLNHLMKPEFRMRLNRLLSRKVSRSLDTYAMFFGSLIQQRWLFYMITKRLADSDSDLAIDNLQRQDTDKPRLLELAINPDNTDNFQSFMDAIQVIIEIVNDICMAQQKDALPTYFNAEFNKQLISDAQSPAAIMMNINKITPAKAEKLLDILGKNIWNRTRISAKKYPNEDTLLFQQLQKAQLHLADHLMQVLYLPEQQEIIELWKIILDEYDRLIYKYKNMTYDDISWFSFEALFTQEPPFLEPESAVSATEFYQFLSHRTRFLLIDEFQDTSLIQFNILKPIIEEITAGEGSKPFGGLVVVGDEKQSIFGWRGGQRDLLLNLQHIFPSLGEIDTERLESSWRCGPTLMRYINAIFLNNDIHNHLQENNMQWSYQMIRSASLKNEPGARVELCIKNYSSAAAEPSSSQEMYADFVKRMVKPALDADPHGSIAILCRKGNELANIQQALDDSEIPSLYQPDRSLTQHRFIAPLLNWLRYVAWGDFTDFISFLRSDYLRINTRLLKQILIIIRKHQEDLKTLSKSVKNQHSNTPALQNSSNIIDFSTLPFINQLQQMAVAQQQDSPTHICRKMIDNCLGGKQLSERDYLNLHRWLDIVAEWEINQQPSGNTMPDLLTYVSENQATEKFKQVSVSSEDSLQLLTIHKSKGLQFKRVFVFYNLSSGHSEDSNKLKWALQYAGKDFQQVSDFGISYHYDKILRASSYAHLWETEQKRQLLEEMNNLYVAFTRAESKLHLYFCYNSKNDWETYLQEHENKNLPIMLCKAALSAFEGRIPDERGIYCLESEFAAPPAEAKKEEQSSKTTLSLNLEALEGISHHKNIPWEQLTSNEPSKIANLKQHWLFQRPNLIGDLLHYYLSYILRNETNEHDYAYKRCLSRFGAIFTRSEIQNYALLCQQSCAANPWLFSSEWDLIFTEHELMHQSKMLRLDRLQLNTREKTALIVDYKSGESQDPQQLESYRNALSALPALQGYHIESAFLKLPH